MAGGDLSNASWRWKAAGAGKLPGRTAALTLAAMLICSAFLIKSPTQASDKDIEATIQKTMPTPVRCGRTTEPLFHCRHDNAADHSMVLELASGPAGPSASLTHDYDDKRRHEFFAIMRGFFLTIGVSAHAFDDCIEQAQWRPGHKSSNGIRLLCYRIELGHRVTHDVFATFAEEAPTLAQAAKMR